MEDPATSMTSSPWSSLTSWFTSTVFFVLLNLMIATIVFTSNLPDNNQPNNHQDQQQEQQDQKKNPQIARSSSILYRLKSFNLYPQKSHHDSSSDTHYHQHPLEVAATQYVFNEDYQHFDYGSTVSDRTHHTQVVDSETRLEHVTPDYDFHHIRQETGGNTEFDFDPIRKESRRNNKAFDFEPTRNDTGFDFDPARKESRTNKGFDFEPARSDTGFNYSTRPEIRNETGTVFEESDEEHADEPQSLDEVYSKLKTGGHDRTKSDGSIRQKPAAKMKKSASLKVGFAHLEEEEIVEARRPETVKEKRSAAVKVVADDDVEVDSRADDFINKFKNDLKLQRIESIIRKKSDK